MIYMCTILFVRKVKGFAIFENILLCFLSQHARLYKEIMFQIYIECLMSSTSTYSDEPCPIRWLIFILLLNFLIYNVHP